MNSERKQKTEKPSLRGKMVQQALLLYTDSVTQHIVWLLVAPSTLRPDGRGREEGREGEERGGGNASCTSDHRRQVIQM